MLKKTTLDAKQQEYDISIYFDTEKQSGTLVVGYRLNPATGIATTGIAITGTQATIGPTNAPLRVISDYQGRGIATALIKSALQLAREQGANSAHAHTQPDNLSAQRSFEKNGFRKTKTTEQGLVELVRELV